MRFVENLNPFAHDEMFQHFAEIPAQCARPAERVEAICKRRREQIVKTVHAFDARVIGQGERSHVRGKSVTTMMWIVGSADSASAYARRWCALEM